MSEPYYNEAGYEKQKGTQQGQENSRMYNEMAILKMVQVSKPRQLISFVTILMTLGVLHRVIIKVYFYGLKSKSQQNKNNLISIYEFSL